MEKNDVKKKGSRLGNLIVILVYLVLGGACGFLMTDTIALLPLEENPFLELFLFAAFLLFFLAALFLSVIIHESGHLLAGLLTGYGFSSFRIGSLMLVKEKGKLRVRLLSLLGTAGQCLLTPPPLINGKCPYILYNLGGALLNLLFAALFFALSCVFPHLPVLRMLLLVAALIGLVFALTNGLPLQLGMVNNDGRNTLEMKRNPRALYAFWLQLAISAETAKGVRLRDMKDEWFLLPAEDGWDDALVSTVAVFCENRLMDERRFDEAETLAKRLLAHGEEILGLYRALLSADLMYLYALSGDKASAMALYDKQQKSFMKQMASFPAVIRADLALALLWGDETQRKSAQARFEKVKKTYPYTVEIESEEELIVLLYEKEGKEGEP